MAEGLFDVERQTQFWCNLPQVVLGQRGVDIQRSAGDIRQQRKLYEEHFGGFFSNGHVLLIKDDAWIMQPTGHDPAQLVLTEVDGYVQAAHVTMAPGYAAPNTWRKFTGSGAGGSSGLLTQAAPAFQKRRAAGTDWDVAQLPADVTAVPQPTPDTPPNYPMDRVLSGLVTYPENTPFLLRLLNNDSDTGELIRFYWGGNCEVLPEDENGGHFCISLRGNGRGTLFEFAGSDAENPWPPIWEFQWAHTHGGKTLDVRNVILIPYARDRLAMLNVEIVTTGTSLLEMAGAIGGKGIEVLNNPRSAGDTLLYLHSGKGADHRHLKSMTGPGTIRADRSRLERGRFSVVKLHYPDNTLLADAPFVIEPDLPLGSPLTMTLSGYAPEGTAIEPTICDADTGVALLREGAAWLTNPGQKRYFVKFLFRSDLDEDHVGEQTPVLFGYTVSLPPGYTTVSATPVITARVHQVSVQGCGISPTESNASAKIIDEIDEVALLRVRDQMRSKLVLVNRADGTPLSVLFEGQTASAEAALRGMTGDVYPSSSWTDYDVRMAGLWPRLHEQFHRGMPFSFASSENSPHPMRSVYSEEEWAPWRITDISRWAANRAGVSDVELDIPDNLLRLFYGENTSAGDLCIMPGTAYGHFLDDLPRDFLGQFWVRDPNAGPVDSSGLPIGLWRLRKNVAASSTNYLATISLDLPPFDGTPRLPLSEGAYGAGVWAVRKDSWKTYPKAAEASGVVVYGTSRGGTDDGWKLLQSQPLVNLACFDPSSAHYLEGRSIDIIRGVDPFLNTVAACDWVARIIYKRACFAEKWFEATIPLVLVVDATDTKQTLPRPLMVNDLILVRSGGVDYPAVVRSFNPNYVHDDWQWGHLEGRFLQ